MSTIVTVASGKGGVGKSVVVSNLGIALANRGLRVALVDLDLGCGSLATLFGAFEAGPDLGQFLSREVDCLQDVLRPIRPNLSLIVGAGETLATANPNYAMKRRLLKHLASLDTDVVLVDVGAGAGIHALDFFNAGSLRLIVTLPEPTASVDAYRFLKLATVRESASGISSRDPQRREVERRDYDRADEVWETVAAKGLNPPVERAPFVIVNQAQTARRSFQRLQSVSRRFLGRDLRLLGEVPRDERVLESVAGFLPIVEGYPSAKAATALREIADRLIGELGSSRDRRAPSVAAPAAGL